MHNQLDNYSAGSVNWRNTLKQNNFRTMVVIALFFLLYLGLGILLDCYLYMNIYSGATLSQLFAGVITLQLEPVATIVMLIVATISLLITYAFADRLMLLGTEYHQITADTANTLEEKQLYHIVEEMQIAAGLPYIPKVYVIDADYMNAFASGFSQRSAMVAITRGLMEKLDRDELQAVIAHEISHIKHLDIKLTLTASLLANLTLIVLDIFFYSSLHSRRGGNQSQNRSRNGNNLVVFIMILRYLLPVVNGILLLYLSRTREYMADAGCVALTRQNEPLARALIKISGDYKNNIDQYQRMPHENVRREAYIFDPMMAGIGNRESLNDLFSTHPSLEKRLQALGYQRSANRP